MLYSAMDYLIVQFYQEGYSLLILNGKCNSITTICDTICETSKLYPHCENEEYYLPTVFNTANKNEQFFCYKLITRVDISTWKIHLLI